MNCGSKKIGGPQSQNSEIESCPCPSVSHACDINANDLLALSDGIQGHIVSLLLCMGNLLDFPEHPVAECVLQTSPNPLGSKNILHISCRMCHIWFG